MAKDKLPLFHVSGIAWDTDGDDPVALNLPSEVVMEGDPEDFADLLSDHFGWCVTGLCADAIPTSDLHRLSELHFFAASDAGGE